MLLFDVQGRIDISEFVSHMYRTRIHTESHCHDCVEPCIVYEREAILTHLYVYSAADI